MKKCLIFCTICLIFFLGTKTTTFITNISNPYGYFVKGPKMNNEHSASTSFLELNNGDLLILGKNTPEDIIDSEIYNLKKNKFEKYMLLEENMYHYPEGILLDKNKLLLIFVHNPKDKYIKEKEFVNFHNYNAMAIVDLNNKKIERYIYKKINKKYKPNQNTKYTKLGNGNIVIMDFDNKIAEIYNPKNNSSKIINLKYKIDPYAKIIPFSNNKVLIFGGYWNNQDYKLDKAVEYKDNDIEIISVGEVLPRGSTLVSKITENKIIIAGGISYNNTHNRYYSQEIEIYDANINKSNVIGNFTEHRQSDPCSVDYSGILLNDTYYIIAGGNRALGPPGSDLASTDIIDLRNNSITKGPKMIYPMANFKMIKLATGNILCIFNDFSQNKFRRNTQLLKLRRK